MADNLRLYNMNRSVPSEAQRAISAGRLKGKTDINPMWRIKALTEMFGPVGEGWWYTVDKIWSEEGNAGERCAFVQISLYYKKEDGQTSFPVIGIGGNMLVAKETKGLYTSDECYKMALTDAISVACKEIGIGADVYWQADRTKYSSAQEPTNQTQTDAQAPTSAQAKTSDQAQMNAQAQRPKSKYPVCEQCNKVIGGAKINNKWVYADKVAETTMRYTGKCLCYDCYKSGGY